MCKVLLCIIAFTTGAESRGYIQSAISEWGSKTCLTFRPKTDADEDYIDFVYEVGYVRLITLRNFYK